MAEPPPPAGGEAGERRTLLVDQQQQAGEAEDQQREDEERRQGERGQRAEQEREDTPAPAVRGPQAIGGARQKPFGIGHPVSSSLSEDCVGRLRTRTRLTRRGSASSTSISKVPGPEINSPRTGTRSTKVTM